MKFRFQQRTPRGLWVSPGVFEANYSEIVKLVSEGHVLGQPRAAVELETGDVIFALDAEGRATLEAAELFAALSSPSPLQ